MSNPWHISGDTIVLREVVPSFKCRMSWGALEELQAHDWRWVIGTIDGDTATYLGTSFDPLRLEVTFTREPATELESWLND